MSLKTTLIKALPPFGNNRVMIKRDHGTSDIINEILVTHKEYETDYDKIYTFFDTGNIYDTCHVLYDFLKQNLTYDAEGHEDQSVKSPSAILHDGERIDCKHYSLFAGGVLDAIKANELENWDWCYRFVSDKSRKHASHVFVVVFDNDTGREIWLDPCMANFDTVKNYILTIDKKPMSLYKISGVNDAATNVNVTVVVPKVQAFPAFLGLLNLNFCAIKDIMLQDMETTNTAVKAYCDQNGYDFQQLLNFLKY